ncbi:MAG: transglutaminase-like domain-containing protein [Candidatus Omnitrophica bacterium]|nr:transglutaminase-like domain-containing protein [Candidatus Omnitrophota bacterium]MDD5591900.1 transglutaminase-like domain-containing protein [Candidatus Omnitrophota bacterium]
MKSKLNKLLFFILILISIFVFLNISVTTRQGINYELHTIKIPLYLKVLDFFDRYYNYKELTKRIVKDAGSEEEKIMRIFEWTHNNIRKAPQELPLVDDHAWYIIVRGYGAKDQSQDVFTTLCNIAGIDAFFSTVSNEDKTDEIPLSFVKMQKKLYVMDAYHGVYFKNSKGRLADIESRNDWVKVSLDNEPNIDYTPYLDNLCTIKDFYLSRPSIQSPLNRLLFEIKRRTR